MMKVDAEVIIIGDSRASHHYVSQIIKDSLKMDAYNCGLDGTNFLYHYCLVTSIINRADKPRVIMLDINPDEFFESDNEEQGAGLVELYPFYPQNKHVQNVIHSIGPWEQMKMLSGMYRYNSRLIMFAQRLMGTDYKSTGGYEAFPISANRVPKKYTKQYCLTDGIKQDYYRKINELKERCEAEGVRLVLSFSPMLIQSNILQTKVYKTLNESVGIVNNNDFLEDPSLFNDNVHLNHNGAVEFTNKIVKELRTIL
ncbi:hypothetical protein EYV94_08235 [Puteibacter caeruleilacunae]|nr:hypothetical protein EYV94_08235 [Puteibacter caeruleilacunae]